MLEDAHRNNRQLKQHQGSTKIRAKVYLCTHKDMDTTISVITQVRFQLEESD
jgi:hypothetical protein